MARRVRIWAFGLVALLAAVLAAPAAAFDGVSLLPRGGAKSVLNASALSGLWYDPARPYTGFTFSFDTDGNVAVTWYVYDTAGNQVFLVGSGPLIGNRAEVPVVITSGGLFPPAYNPGQVTLTAWGTVVLDIVSCTQIDVSWTSTRPGFGPGTLRVAPLIVTGGLPCQVSQDDDAGNSCEEAATVPANGAVTGRIDPEDDFDFFRVVVPDSGALRARSTTDPSLDPYGALLDASCEVIIENDDTIERQFDVAGIVPAGTYFVRVSSYGSASTGGFNVAISFDASANDDYPDDCGSAQPIPASGTLTGNIDFGIDADVFRVQLTEGGTFTAESSETSSLDPLGELLNADCEVIDESDDYNNRDFFFSDVLEPGTYYVRVRSYARLSTGPYRLRTNFSPGTAPTDDHGDICGSATELAINGTATGTIGVFDDDDFFRVVVPTRGTLTSGTSLTGTLDPELAVFDFECQRIAENDDYGPGRNSLLTLAVDPGEYFVRVHAFNAGSTGTYAVTPTFTPTTPAGDDHGNSCATATRIAPEFSALGRISPASDRDFFVFDVDGQATFTVSSADSNSLDPIGAVLDANCNVIAENDDSDGGDFSVSVPVDVGTYYIRVGSADGTSADDYQINFGYSESGAPAAVAAAAKRGATATGAAKLVVGSELATAKLSGGPKARPAAKAVVNPSSLSGLWYDPAQPYQGFSLSFGEDGGVAVAWYVYSATRQAWVIGNSALQGNRATIPMFIATGNPGFPPNYDPSAVTLVPWGTLTLELRDCDAIRVSWTSSRPGYNDGTLDVVPLIVSGGLSCEVIPETDDYGNNCAAATAINLNTAGSGRIDPTTDEDYFRFTVGSRGDFSVQSGGSTTLNPRGALLDAACQVVAQNDDATGREFALSRTLDAGTYYLRVAASNAASIGSYGFATSFSATTGGGTSNVTLQLENELIYDVDFRVNGGEPIRVLAGMTMQSAVTVNGPLAVSFGLVGADIQGRPIGDLRGGSFDPVANPSGTIRFSVTNRIGNQVFFAPVIANKQAATILVGTNMGLAQENRCNCTVPGGARETRIGYYELLANSNVRGYAGASSYAGSYVVWGSDPSGAGRQQLPVPLINVVQSPSGRTSLQAAVLPF